MSINWRASLVPAAAVIPAPRAYTIIAAVKTPVVCLWAQVCWVAGARAVWGAVRCAVAVLVAGQNPQWYVPVPDLITVRDLLLLEASFTGSHGGLYL